MARPTLYLMLGYPGAGKTTTAGVIAELTGAVHLASDRLRLELFPKPAFTPQEHQALYQILDKRTEQLLAGGKSVIYDANLNRYVHRQEKYAICERTNAQPLLIWVQVDKALAKTRATTEFRQQPIPPHEPPDAMFERIVSILEPPRENEKVVKLDGTKIAPDYVKRELQI